MADMSPGAVDRRLRQVASLVRAAVALPEHAPEQQRRIDAVLRQHGERGVSMSPEAVDRRLREVAELLRLCLELGRVSKAGD